METILGKTEFLIEKYTRKDCIIRKEGKCYIVMFKYEQKEGEEHWCFSLPIQPMYLMTIHDAKATIIRNIEEDKSHGWKAEYKLAEIVNEKQPRSEKTGTARIGNFNHSNGKITIEIDALGTMYVPKLGDYGYTMLYNSAPLLEGINLIMKYGHEAVNAIKKELQ